MKLLSACSNLLRIYRAFEFTFLPTFTGFTKSATKSRIKSISASFSIKISVTSQYLYSNNVPRKFLSALKSWVFPYNSNTSSVNNFLRLLNKVLCKTSFRKMNFPLLFCISSDFYKLCDNEFIDSKLCCTS